jgi:hypothetical protein
MANTCQPTQFCVNELPKIVEAKPGGSFLSQFRQINRVLYEAWTKLSDAEKAKYILAPSHQDLL